MLNIDYAGDAALLGISEERYRKGRRQLAQELARKNRRCVPRPHHCRGGPFDGQKLLLTGNDSIFFRIGSWRGRYSGGYWLHSTLNAETRHNHG